METNSAKPIIWAVSDGRAGNVAMASGLAQRVGQLTGGHVERFDVATSGGVSRLPNWIICRMPRIRNICLKRVLAEGQTLPDLVIGAGRRVAVTVSVMRETGTRTVQIMNPQMPLNRFDMIIAPMHDRLRGPNVFETLGSVGGITPRVLDAVRSRENERFAEMRRPLMAVLVGGDTKRAKVSDAQWHRFADDLAQMSKTIGLLVTPSRRTPPSAITILREALTEGWIWDGESENPYLEMLASADCVLVTDDSINMASEAAAGGKPLAIYPLLQEDGKTARFHEALIAAGHAERFDGLPTAHAAPLDETGRAAEAVRALL